MDDDRNDSVIDFPGNIENTIADRMDRTLVYLDQQTEQQKIFDILLQEKLDKTNLELKQLNDKYASQNLYIKELQRNLKKESLQREIAETKLSARDWKTATVALGSALFILAVEHWKEICDFVLLLMQTKQ